MGRYACACCGELYYERRFLWEDYDEPEATGEAAQLLQGLQPPARSLGGQPGPEDTAPTGDARGGDEKDGDCASERGSLGSTESGAESSVGEGGSADERADQGIGVDAHGALPAGTQDKLARSCTAPVSETSTQAKVIADAIRATGTAANVTGTIVPVASSICAPFSAVGGIVGATAGFAQLATGLSTPSGRVDPHLVTKGSLTASVGSTCMILGACAAATPPLFAVALSLGVAGLGAATTIDAFMGGLCPKCTEQVPQAALTLPVSASEAQAQLVKEAEEWVEAEKKHQVESQKTTDTVPSTSAGSEVSTGSFF